MTSTKLMEEFLSHKNINCLFCSAIKFRFSNFEPIIITCTHTNTFLNFKVCDISLKKRVVALWELSEISKLNEKNLKRERNTFFFLN